MPACPPGCLRDPLRGFASCRPSTTTTTTTTTTTYPSTHLPYPPTRLPALPAHPSACLIALVPSVCPARLSTPHRRRRHALALALALVPARPSTPHGWPSRHRHTTFFWPPSPPSPLDRSLAPGRIPSTITCSATHSRPTLHRLDLDLDLDLGPDTLGAGTLTPSRSTAATDLRKSRPRPST
ncbi:uncharacterized protein PSFLO_07478 [Pseudozyma flocculosa]|uniref:Uncharacterized protein n=1 Tax=Pseudozyma flocculosa TaxID=84751 RepID=A0A5C3FE74_9BASI|nr:uncharacterized protein PSFLO_07478 [Pseudozyma flocculosa]